MTWLNSRSPLALGIWSIVLIAGVSAALYATFAKVNYNWNWSGFWTYRFQFLEGWLTTLGISAVSIVFSVIVGFLLMVGSRSDCTPVRLFSSGMTTILRGTPLLVQLLIGYYVIANRYQINEPLLVGTLLLGFFEGAYLAEIFRGAVESIGASQRESARAVGFSVPQTYRYVIIPQAFRRALPGTTGQLVSLIKDSSLLSVIGIEELVQKVRILNAGNYTALEGYIPLAIAYLAVTLPLTWWARTLERRFAYET